MNTDLNRKVRLSEISIAKTLEAINYLRMVDSLNLNEIAKVYECELGITIPQKAIDEWKFVGLCNHDFISIYDSDKTFIRDLVR